MADRLFQRIARASQWYDARYTPLGRLLGTLTIAAAIFATDPTRTHASILLAGLFAIFLGAFLLNRRWQPALSAVRQLPAQAVVGVPLTYHIVLHNHGRAAERALVVRDRLQERFPAQADRHASGVTASDTENWFDRRVGFRRWLRRMHELRGAEIPPVGAAPVPAGGRADITIRLTPLRRGVVEFARVEVARADPLGVSYVARRLPSPQQLLVLPRRHPIADLGTARAGTAHASQLSHVGNVQGGHEFHALREYRAGDSLRHIHWRASAKRGVHVVKQFVESHREPLWLLLDPVAEPALFEALIEVAASLVVAASRQPARDLRLEWLEPGTPLDTPLDRTGVRALLEALAVRTCATRDRFDRAIAQLRPDPRATLLFVTANWDAARQAFSARVAAAAPASRTLAVADDNPRLSGLGGHCTLLRAAHLAEDLHGFTLSRGP